MRGNTTERIRALMPVISTLVHARDGQAGLSCFIDKVQALLSMTQLQHCHFIGASMARQSFFKQHRIR